MFGYGRVGVEEFREAIASAGEARPMIAQATTEPDDLPEGGRYYLSEDRQSGYGIVGDVLVGVFSTVKGRGAMLVQLAQFCGARRLDCFDGHLTAFYARFGFMETAREANWTPGEPDVVWMEVAA